MMKRTKKPKKSLQSIVESKFPIMAKIGRPCKYEKTPDYYNSAIMEHMAEGMTMEAAGIRMGVAPWTIHEWATKFPEFSMAVKKGAKLREIWWMEQGRINIYNPKFNTPLYIRIMANLYGWRSDKVEVQGKLDHNHEHSTTNQQVNLDKLSKTELQQLKTFVEKAIDARGANPITTIH